MNKKQNNIKLNIKEADKKIKDIRYFLYQKYEEAIQSDDYYGKSSELATSLTFYFEKKSNKYDTKFLGFSLYYDNFYEINSKEELYSEIPFIGLEDLGINNIELLQYNEEIRNFRFSEEEANDILEILGYNKSDIEKIKENLKEQIGIHYKMLIELDGQKVKKEQLEQYIKDNFQEEFYLDYIFTRIKNDIYFIELNSLNNLTFEFLKEEINKKQKIIKELLEYFKRFDFKLKLELNNINIEEFKKIHIQIYSYVFGPNRNHYFDFIMSDKYKNIIEFYNDIFPELLNKIKLEWDFDFE